MVFYSLKAFEYSYSDHTLLGLLILIILIIPILFISSLFSKIFKKQSKSIENEDLGTPIYCDLDILLQEKPIYNNSQEFIPEIPLNTKVSLSTKIIVVIISLTLIFNYLNI